MRKRGVGVWERVKKGCISVLQHPCTPHTHAGMCFRAPQIVDLTHQHDKEAPIFVGVNVEVFVYNLVCVLLHKMDNHEKGKAHLGH
jgi:hypothetical protein